MKRWIALLAAFAMVFTMSACTAEELLDTTLQIMEDVTVEEELLTEELPAEDFAEILLEEDIPEEDIPELPEEEIAEFPEEDAETIWEEESTEIVYPEEELGTSSSAIPEDGTYTHKDDVALYIYTYGELPDNFMTKNEARDLGWSGGGLDDYAPGMCIGGDRFGNYEGLLPEAPGRTYTECDIDTLGADSRGAKRIVFSNDGLIYYTDDHYESFELLYGTP